MTDRPLGHTVPNWTPARDPFGIALNGRYANLHPLDVAKDAPGLWMQMKDAPWLWDYLGQAAPADFHSFCGIIAAFEDAPAHPCLVIRAKGNDMPLGYACFWTNAPDTGSTEIGNVNLSPALQHTPIATEAFFIMIDWAFANGYRRVRMEM